MRKFSKIFLSLLLLVAIMLSCASCDSSTNVFSMLFGIDGGRKSCGLDNYQYCVFWIDTYDEMIYVLDKMKAAGTQTPQIPAFNCEEYGIDIKFQIVLRRSAVEQLKEGQNYYDVKLSYVSIYCCLFFETVTLEQIQDYSLHELESGFVNFRLYTVRKFKHSDVLEKPYYRNVRIHNEGLDGNPEYGKYYIYYNTKNQFYMEKSHIHFDLTEEQIEILEKTLVIIE